MMFEGHFDERAVDAWSHLYRVGGWRKSQAMELLHKLLKKDHGSRGPANPAAFMSRSVSNAWTEHPPAWWREAFGDDRDGSGAASSGGPGVGGKGHGAAWGKGKGK